MQRILLAFLTFISLSASSQKATRYVFSWEAKPAIHKVPEAYKNDAAVFIEDNRIIEYIVEEKGFFTYRTFHRIVHINSDKGIESFNRIYLPDEGIEMVDVGARTILPDGKVIQLDRKNIKDHTDEDGTFKIFALDGLTKGCDIEYYFTIKKYPSFFGREMIASGLPVVKSKFELISPEHLAFETKGYHNLPQVVDTILAEKRYIRLTEEMIAAAKEEKYSMYQANLKRIEFKLSYNKGKNAKERLFTWSELAKKVYDIYTEIDDKQLRKVKTLLEGIDLKAPAMEKATAIENRLKKEFVVRDDISSEDADDLPAVMKKKIASEKAIAKLFVVLLKEAGVDYQIALAGNRENYEVDRQFENWNAAANFLIYFPQTKKFMAPTEVEYRYPWIPPTWTATNALFCVTTTIGDFTTAMAEIRPVPVEDVKHSYSNMDVKVKLDGEDALLMDVKHSYGGYTASNYKLPYIFLPADQQKETLKQMVKFGTGSENILSHSFENKELEQKDPYAPFVINASVKSTALIERAGDKLIIKVGEMIGQQAEMYDAEERKTMIDVNYPHLLVRNIQLTIPKGYRVKNLEDLKTSLTDGTTGSIVFKSDYTLEGEVLKITIHEAYNKVNYDKKEYDFFKKVINAAADFNKVVLVLERA